MCVSDFTCFKINLCNFYFTEVKIKLVALSGIEPES